MHPLEFIALNMRSRQKVRIHYKKWDKDCFLQTEPTRLNNE